MFSYTAQLARLVGPVTVSAHIDLGFDVRLTHTVRLDGVTLPDTPAKREAAIELVGQWLDTNPTFTIQTVKNRQKEKFGRYLGVITSDAGESLNQLLLDAQLVEVYRSGQIPDAETE